MNDLVFVIPNAKAAASILKYAIQTNIGVDFQHAKKVYTVLSCALRKITYDQRIPQVSP
jgi:hypothetical protein